MKDILKQLNIKQINIDRFLLDKKKLLLVAIVALIIVFLDISFVLKMQLSGLRAAGPKIAKLRKDISALDKDLENMQALKKKQEEDSRAGISAAKKLLSAGQITTLLQYLSELAQKDGIRISQIKHAADTVDPKAKKTVTGPENLIGFTIGLDLICDYHTFGKFINQLENGQYFLSVQELRILPLEALKQKIYVGLRTYVRK
jgi:Tfp pilus assembly protein PilO